LVPKLCELVTLGVTNSHQIAGSSQMLLGVAGSAT